MTRSLCMIMLYGILSIGCFTLVAQDKEAGSKNDKAINTKQKTPVKIIEYIVGTWKINGDDSNASNSSGTQQTLGKTIKFNREGRFVTSSGQEKLDSGAYRLNEDHAILYLESVSSGQPTEWNVSFRKNVMTLWPRERETSAHAQNHKYVYSRSGATGGSSN